MTKEKNLKQRVGPTCPMCNKICGKIVPMQDHDQEHKGQMACIDCKRAIRKGEPIKKFGKKENA